MKSHIFNILKAFSSVWARSCILWDLLFPPLVRDGFQSMTVAFECLKSEANTEMHSYWWLAVDDSSYLKTEVRFYGCLWEDGLNGHLLEFMIYIVSFRFDQIQRFIFSPSRVKNESKVGDFFREDLKSSWQVAICVPSQRFPSLACHIWFQNTRMTIAIASPQDFTNQWMVTGGYIYTWNGHCSSRQHNSAFLGSSAIHTLQVWRNTC